MINKNALKAPKKKINSRRKSRELIMKGVYRALVNQFDINKIKHYIEYICSPYPFIYPFSTDILN